MKQTLVLNDSSVPNLPHWLSSDQLHILNNGNKGAASPNPVALRRSSRLTSDEMLFLEQPAEGVTLLASLEDSDSSEFSQLNQPSFFITIDGKKQLALGLYKTEGTARVQALALQDAMPNLQMTPISVDLLQQNILRRSEKWA